MSSMITQQSGQNVTLSGRETRALARIGVAPGDLQLPAAGLVLSDQQQAFVAEYVQNGGKWEEAARTAELPDPAKDGRALMRLGSIQAAIRREQALAVAGLITMSDKVLSDILSNSIGIDPKVKIAAARVAYERGGVLKRAALEAERDAGGAGALSAMTPDQLERVILEASARLAAADPTIIDVTPEADTAPIAPGSAAVQPAETMQDKAMDIPDAVSGAQGRPLEAGRDASPADAGAGHRTVPSAEPANPNPTPRGVSA